MMENLGEQDLYGVTVLRGQEFLAKLIAELKKRGHEVEQAALSELEIVQVDGEFVNFKLEVQVSQYGGSYDPTGRLRCIVGIVPRKNYPEPKKGFDLETAITRILAVVEVKKREEQLRVQQDELDGAARMTLDRARKLFGIDEFGWLEVNGIAFDAGDETRVRVNLLMTPEELVEFVASRSVGKGGS